jgi:hypothetical protein
MCIRNCGFKIEGVNDMGLAFSYQSWFFGGSLSETLIEFWQSEEEIHRHNKTERSVSVFAGKFKQSIILTIIFK